MKLRENIGADAVLVLTTVVWGSTFTFSKDILERWPPFSYLVLRMAVAALLLAALFRRQLARARGAEWRAGATLGALLGAGLAGQTLGLYYTTAPKSAFVTGLTTPLIPFFAYFCLRAGPALENLLGVVIEF